MPIQLADRSQFVSNSIYCVSLIVCDTGAWALSAVVECHIVQSLSHDIVLGFDWLCTCKPHINCWACNLLVKVPGGPYLTIYLVILLCMLNLILWAPFEKRLTVLQLLGSQLSIQLSFLTPWGRVILLLGSSLGMSRLTVGMICILSFLVYLGFEPP